MAFTDLLIAIFPKCVFLSKALWKLIWIVNRSSNPLMGSDGPGGGSGGPGGGSTASSTTASCPCKEGLGRPLNGLSDGDPHTPSFGT